MRRAIARILRGTANHLAPLRIPNESLREIVSAVFTGDHGVILADPTLEIDPALLERCDLFKLEV